MIRLGRRVAPFALTLIVALSLAVPATYLAAPYLHQWLRLRQLTSDDLRNREAALNLVIRRAATDGAVARGAIARLAVDDDRNFIQIVSALEAAGVWDRRRVPPEAWVRWLRLVAERDDPESQIFVAQRLGELDPAQLPPGSMELLGRMWDSESAEVRYNALVAVAPVAQGARGEHARDRAASLILDATGDAEPRIARHAWIFAGLLRLSPPEYPGWRTAPAGVVEAMLWARVQASPGRPEPVIAALNDPAAPPAVRAAAAYALAFADTPAAAGALLAAASPWTPEVTLENQLVIWRAILSLPKPDLTRRPLTPLEEVVSGWTADETADPLLEPIGLAAVWRLGIAGARHAATDEAAYDQLLKLATVEGQEPPYMFWPLVGFKSPLLRAQTLAVARLPPALKLDDPTEPVNAILPVLGSEDAALRDLGVSVAARRFDVERNRHLIRTLLTDFNESRRMSGAMLAGLTGLRVESQVRGERVDLLEHLAEREDNWSVRQVLRLGLWMQGRLPEMETQAAAYLLRGDVPHTTILLAMLHRGRVGEVCDWLFNPRGEPPVDLVELFDQRRWWYVLRPYLPEDAPPFWVWADPGLEAFQVDVLRDWSLISPRATVE